MTRYIYFLMMSSLCLLISDCAESPKEKDRRSLPEILADNEELRGQLEGFEECKSNRAQLEKQNAKLRQKVDKANPDDKRATNEIQQSIQDTAKLKIYFWLAIIGLTLSLYQTLDYYSNCMSDYISEKLNRFRKSAKQTDGNVHKRK